jgi:lipopolysaccharide export system protein LptC
MIRERITTLAPLALVALLAALTFWLDQIAQPSGRGAGASRLDPDYIVDKLSAVSLGKAGTPTYTLTTARMTHYPDGDTTLLATPRFVSHSSPQAPITVTSSEAIVSGDGQNVYFQDDVRVTRDAHGPASELVVKTDFLHVMPEEKIAKTDRTVTITDATGVVTAEGFEINNETRIIKLLSKVRGTYEPVRTPRN